MKQRGVAEAVITWVRTSVTGTFQSSLFGMGPRPQSVRFGSTSALNRPAFTWASLTTLRVHASVRGQRGAANMLPVLCNSDLAISLSCSMWFGNSPDHGIIGTASLGVPRRPAVRRATVGRSSSSSRIGHRDFEPEVGVINPHAVQDHPDPPYQGDHGALCTTAPGDLSCPSNHVERPRCIRTVAA